ncbi:MAG: histidinol dehydrogenase [Desulfovibrionaceae bacterium]|nr:histidinol dehydrogenase [Desulfovibrionaceae bacterium]
MAARRIDYAGPDDWPRINAWLKDRAGADGEVERRVREIIDAVRERGDQAVAEYTARFDCPRFTAEMLRVPKAEIEAAAAAVPARDLALLKEAAANVRAFHERQKENSWWTTTPDGAILGQMVRPLDRVGLYVPGGRGGETPLVSSLIMNAAPAIAAGVPEIAVAGPPRKDGTLSPYILTAAKVLGLDEVYRMGGAWAVAALALGTDTVRACDLLAGPGNIYVATAKALLRGRVGVDLAAGPSEIAILAEDSGDPDLPAWLAADMLSQAEHDPLASALLLTPDKSLAERAAVALAARAKALPRAEIANAALDNWGAIITLPDLDSGLDLVNLLAPEHLELAVDDPWSLLGRVRHAGAVFLGRHCPEPVGDYFAGPNHVLPTMGTARFSSALSVQDFCKKSSVIATNRGYIEKHGAKIARLARIEGLEAHARSVEVRLGKNTEGS